MTALATAVGVLDKPIYHRPPLGHVSPSAAALRDAGTETDLDSVGWRDVVGALALIVVFWVLYVSVWAIFGGAA